MRVGHDHGVVSKDIAFADGKVEVEDIEELALDPANVALAEYTSAERPVDVLECGIIQILEKRDSD